MYILNKQELYTVLAIGLLVRKLVMASLALPVIGSFQCVFDGFMLFISEFIYCKTYRSM